MHAETVTECAFEPVIFDNWLEGKKAGFSWYELIEVSAYGEGNLDPIHFVNERRPGDTPVETLQAWALAAPYGLRREVERTTIVVPPENGEGLFKLDDVAYSHKLTVRQEGERRRVSTQRKTADEFAENPSGFA